MPNPIKCLIYVKEYGGGIMFALKAWSYEVNDIVSLLDGVVIRPESKLSGRYEDVSINNWEEAG